MRWIGLDVHHKFIQVAEVTDAGATKQVRYDVDPAGIRALAEGLDSTSQVIMEAGTSSGKLHDALQPYAGSVVVAHANHTRAAGARHVKTDPRDAETLALLLKSGFARATWVPAADCRALRGLVEYRTSLVVWRTATVNRIRSVFRADMADYPEGLSSDHMDRALGANWDQPHTDAMVHSLVAIGEAVSDQIRRLDNVLAQWCGANPQAKLLMTIPGVGVVVAATLLSEIGDISRFSSPGRLCAYAGLVPTVHASGKTLRIGHVSPASRRRLRSALYLATMILTRCDKRFSEVYGRLCTRRPKKVALIACARKLLVVVWHMLKERTAFRREQVVVRQGRRASTAVASAPDPFQLTETVIAKRSTTR